MIIDLSCPIELRGYEIMHDDSGAARAYIDLFNLSEETVSGYGATVRWSRDETRESANDDVSVDAIAIPGGGLFKLVLSTGLVKYADRVELYFNRVDFTSGEIWKPKDGELVDVGEFVPLEGEELDRLKAAAGEDAYIFPEMQDNFWRCVCGRINPLDADRCMRCLRERNYVLAELNRKSLNMDDEAVQRREKRVRRAQEARSKVPKKDGKADIYLILLLISVTVFVTLSVLICAF